jgi:inosine/xanthosine triphosphate pyrophosphatase family protein
MSIVSTPNLVFATGNREKFAVAQITLADAGIELGQAAVDIDEIQGEDAEGWKQFISWYTHEVIVR